VRYFGLRAGWWSTLLPIHQIGVAAHAAISAIHAFVNRVISWF
jgi:hypothetical protein